MANGISRRSLYEALQQSTDKDGILDLWRAAELLGDDVESWGETDYYGGQEPHSDPPPPRFWQIIRVKSKP